MAPSLIDVNRCVATVSRDIHVLRKKPFRRMDVQMILTSNALEALLVPGFGRYGEVQWFDFLTKIN